MQVAVFWKVPKLLNFLALLISAEELPAALNAP
jgi:hypothetical protein